MTDRFNKTQQKKLDAILALPVAQRAEAIARMVHAKQKDKAQAPYTEHPERVASIAVRNMRALKDRFTEKQIESVRQASWLHDVLEDSGDNGFPKVSATDLKDWGIPSNVITLVKLVTKTKKSPDNPASDPYFAKIKGNPLARALKIADMTDNHNLDRKEALQELGIQSKNYYYGRAIDFLGLTSEERLLFEKRINLPAAISEEEWQAALLEPEEVEPSYYTDMSMEDYYYRNRNSGSDEYTASSKASEQVASDGLFLSYRHEGYSVKRAREKASGKPKEKN
jgi:hypothetical protein